MGEWWAMKPIFEKVLWFCAVPASVILLIQMLLTFLGFDGTGDSDVEVDADAGFEMDGDIDGDQDHGMGFPFFTFRNFIAFFTVFGWTGIMMTSNGHGVTITLIVSIFAGVVMMFLISLLFYLMSRLASSGGTYSLRQAVGKEGTVYVRVPKKGNGQGKVNVKLNHQMRELDALSESEEDLTAGTIVRVSKIVSNKLVVERV